MFGGTKNTFGTSTTGTGFTSFNAAATPSPFGQSAFGKPAASAFGAAPTFGSQQPASSLFGATATQAQPTGLFGSTNTSTFGGTTTTQPAFGVFSQPQQNTSIFGTAQPTTGAPSLFGQSSTSAFGSTVKPGGLGGFGTTATQPSTSLFGQSAAATSTSGFGSFGQTAPATSNVFGNTSTSAFGQPTTLPGTNPGSSIAKYQPTIGTDTLMKGGQANNINTKLHCITAMKEYETKSLEEIRFEDYLANRKGGGLQAGTTGTGSFFGAGAQQQATGTGLFGSAQQQTSGLFGQPAAGTENKGLFGSSAFGQTATPAFGAATQQQTSFLGKPFGAATTSAFGAPATDANAGPFGAKPAFGNQPTTGLFGQTPAVSTSAGFGTNTGFGGFGAAATTQQPSLFGTTATDPRASLGFGQVPTGNTSFLGFDAPQTSTAGTGGIFGIKPAAGFGTTPAFGATSTANTGFGTGFSANQTGGGIFNSTWNKPPNTSIGGGFGTATSSAPLNFNAGTGATSLFGNTAAKPGGLFGGTLGTGTNTTGGGLFGGGTGGFGTGATLSSAFGTNTLGGANTTLGGFQQQQQQAVPIHQQILAKVISPYGDNPIFKDLKRNDETDPARATNPAAQKAILELSTGSPFKISSKPSPIGIKIKPVGSTVNKKSLFEGLEEFDASVENFSLKPNAKRLVINPKSKTNVLVGNSNGNTSIVENGEVNTSVVDGSANSSQTTPQRGLRNEIFAGEIPSEPTAPQSAVQGKASVSAAAAPKDDDTSRRESWLHPQNLEKGRQKNLNNTGNESQSSLNNTLSELVPRKPLETYRPPSRGSVAIRREQSYEEDSSGGIARRDTVAFTDNNNESTFSNRSYDPEEISVFEPQAEYEEHPTGITLRRIGYYTIPSLDELKTFLAEDGSCVVPNFTIGRTGYGSVHFSQEMDVAGLNLDEIVHFRNKEITIYPNDDDKPPFGSGLNREAQVTLEQVWPMDKTTHEPIKDHVRLAEMDWEGKLRRVCAKNETRFMEYRPETGSWVFRVKHFSKYGINDSDEDDNTPTDPKKAKIASNAAAGGALVTGKPMGGTNEIDKMTLSALKNAQKISEDAARALDPKAFVAGVTGSYAMDESAEFMLMDKTQFFQNNDNDFSMFDRPPSYALNGNAPSPTAALAKDAGTDAHKLQLMKASFFNDDDIDQAAELGYQRRRQRKPEMRGNRDLQTSSQSLWKEGLVTPSEASSQMDFGLDVSPHPPSSLATSVLSIVRETQMETTPCPTPDSDLLGFGTTQAVKMPPFIVKPKVAQVKSHAVQVPFIKSIAQPICGKWAADLGLYNSRRFKLSFGPQNTLIVPTTRNNLQREIKNENLIDVAPRIFKLRDSNDFSATVLQHVQISSTLHYDHFKQSIEEHLQIELRKTVWERVEGSECPWFKSNGGTELIVEHLDAAITQINLGALEEYAVSVWSLCMALWGDHEELEGHEPISHFAVMCRRNLLSEWLENTLTDQDLLTKSVSKQTYLDHLLELVMCHKVTEACELAFKYDDANLALLLAQLSSGPVVRQLMEDQLAAWHANQADTFIQLERLKLFMLVAGVSLMTSSHGPINTLEGVEWIKVLAIQLWYLSSPTSSITDALLSYEKSFKAEEFYSLPPTPCYAERSTVREKQELYDLRYHLLQLFSKRSHPMESLLNPATHTADPMDFRLSWFILQTLEALGYHHCSELSESQLHVGFASQLENHNLWEWAIFVLLHVKDRNQRELAVQNILYRYVSISKDGSLSEKEKFVVDDLGVPEKWLDYAKAVKAGAERSYHLQAKYLLRAKQWSLAHEVIFQHIAPDAVINDNLDYLHDLLTQFEGSDTSRTVKVPNWSNQGQIFLDFIDINEKFKNLKTLKTEADIEAHWENLKPQLADLCSRINLLPCPTSKHRLCQSEIAQNLAFLVRGVLLVCPVLNPCLIIKIALERLPLPQEFAQQEVRALLDTLVSDLSKAKSGSTNLITI